MWSIVGRTSDVWNVPLNINFHMLPVLLNRWEGNICRQDKLDEYGMAYRLSQGRIGRIRVLSVTATVLGEVRFGSGLSC